MADEKPNPKFKSGPINLTPVLLSTTTRHVQAMTGTEFSKWTDLKSKGNSVKLNAYTLFACLCDEQGVRICKSAGDAEFFLMELMAGDMVKLCNAALRASGVTDEEEEEKGNSPATRTDSSG